jgi:23S rRNA pseudouridine2605 synthase
MTGIRINRYIASTGEISRRKADEMLREGRVRVNGTPASLGDSIDPATDRVTIDGKPVSPQKIVYLAMYKPRNVVTTMHDPQGRPCIRDHIPSEYAGVFPIGRLDFNAEGLLLLTNDGALAHYLHHPSFNVPKTYVVEVTPRAAAGQIGEMREGIMLDGSLTRSAEIETLSTHSRGTTLRITLRQGLKNQIKRMARAVGLQVASIKRTSVGPITLEGIRPGETRELKPREIQNLHKTLK